MLTLGVHGTGSDYHSELDDDWVDALRRQYQGRYLRWSDRRRPGFCAQIARFYFVQGRNNLHSMSESTKFLGTPHFYIDTPWIIFYTALFQYIHI